MNLINKFNKSLLKKGDSVIVALSGGPDSTALLLMLLKVQKELALKLSVAHVNYNLRGKDSKNDLFFAESLAKKHNLPFFLLDVNSKKEFPKHGVSLQDKARNLRYAFFVKTAGEIGANKVAVGHNKNDQVETVLMRLFRGSGSAGLSGMPVKRDLAPGLTLIRPLLSVTREEINSLLVQSKVKARTDKSNLRSDYVRNSIRLELIPELKKKFNSSVESNITRAAEQLALEDELLAALAGKVIKVSKKEYYIPEKVFEAMHPALKPRALRELIRKALSAIKGLDSRHLAAILSGKKRIDLPGGAFFLRTEGRLFVKKAGLEKKPAQVKLAVPGAASFGDYKVAASLKDVVKYFGGRNEAFLDAGKVVYPLFLRGRKNGDSFVPFGMKGCKKLQDYMTDEKIPVYKRDAIPLIVDAAGKILWIAGHRPDERFRVTKDTKKVLCLKLK